MCNLMTIDAKARSLLLVCAIALPCLVFANHGHMVPPKQTIAASTQQKWSERKGSRQGR